MTPINKKVETQDNINNNNKVIEQLWYTWSDVGIDSISAGFRIRKASAGLRDVRSELIRRLDPYQRYLLPSDANRSIDPRLAPVCLALINTGKERILVHKAYTGRDGVGRYGAFFIHLLENLPQEFSLLDAIALWQSPFWQRSDVKDLNTELARVSLADLRQWWKPQKAFDQQTVARIREYLPRIIESYLTKNLLREKQGPGAERQKIYIAASDNDVAILISGLIHGLPAQLVQGLTFSTYEPDVNEATTEIVGTCWLSVPKAEQNQIVAHLLPPRYYQERLAFNCYTGVCSPPTNHPLAAQCAQDATEYFLDPNSVPEFQGLLDTITPKLYPNLRVSEFLEQYETLVVRAQTPSQSDVERVLTSRTPLQYDVAGKLLVRTSYRNKFFDLVQNKRGWWETNKTSLSRLRKNSTGEPLIIQALDKIARHAVTTIVDIVEKEANAQGDLKFDTETPFRTMIDVMRCAAPPKEEPSIWRTLRDELLRIITPTQNFLHKHRSIYAELIGIWSIALPLSEDNNKLLTPFLTITWAEFGSFLTLRLPPEWIEIATFILVYQSSPPGQEIVRDLEQKYHSYIESLLRQLSQDVPPLAIDLFSILITEQYQERTTLLFVLLDSLIGNDDNTAKRLLQVSHLRLDEKAQFLTEYGPRCLPNNKLRKILLDLFTELTGHDLRTEKMRILFSWLASPLLDTWFDSSQTGEQNLTTVLTKALVSREEIDEFFQVYGEKYITRYPWSLTLINLFDSYARSGGEQRIPLLYTWLKCNLQSEEVLRRVLESAHLQSNERVNFLLFHGVQYLQLYPQSRLLASYVQEFLAGLWNADVTIFKGRRSPEEPSTIERLLEFLSKFPLPYVPPDLVYHWYAIARFVRQPSLLKKEWRQIAQGISRLVNTPSAMGISLLQELAGVCIANESEVKATIDNISTVLSIPALVQLLYAIAKRARYGINERQYRKTLYIPCISYAIGFKVLLPPQAQQEFSVESFLNTLLPEADEATFQWISKQAKRWPTLLSTEWHRYMYRRFPGVKPLLPETSWFERIELFWERTIAFRQMRRALKNNGIKKILQVGTDYITTLNNYPQKVPHEYWQRLDEVLDIDDATRELSWNQYEAERHLPTIVQNHLVTNKPEPAPFSHISSWGQRTIAFMQVRQALRSRKIGRIVRVTTEHIIILDRYRRKVPQQWWRQMDTAFDIFIALEVEYEESEQDRDRERDIVAASQKLDKLVDARHPTPRLTMHERRRIKVAAQYVARQDAQKLKNEHQQQIPPTSQDPLADQQRTQLPPDTAQVKGASRGIFGWLRPQSKKR